MLDLIAKQPFPGFEKDALKFLNTLSNPANNNKAWFDEHRNEYEIYLKEPMRNLIDTLSEKISKIDSDIVVNYKSIFRINRDIRFSKNKAPYKSHYSAAFAFDRVKSSDIPQFYFHFNKDEFLFAAGQYSSDINYLKKIRKGIYSDFKYFRSIIENKKFIANFGSVNGESLIKLPKDYGNIPTDKDGSLLIKYLKMKQYYVFKTYKPEIILDENITEVITGNISLSLDFTKFLNSVSK
jgi:uncharacterized protein (TIGR02453 family)